LRAALGAMVGTGSGRSGPMSYIVCTSRVECVDRAWMCVGGEKTENAKPGDRSPSPRYYYGGYGIFESFRSTFPYKVLISILNIIALMDRDFQNRAAGSVTT